MTRQDQFLDVINRDEAERRFHAALRLAPCGVETVLLPIALGRVLAVDVRSPVDVPAFDRSNVDGFAIQAADSFGASELQPRCIRLLDETIASAVVPRSEIVSGTSAAIATGGMIPRGADAVVMIEHADDESGVLSIRRAVTPGANVSFAGTDIATGEIVLRRGELLTSRETGVLAAIGLDRVTVWRKPIVAVISTGDEIIAPGQPMRPGCVFDSNARILADAVREAGGEPLEWGILADDTEQLRAALGQAIQAADGVLLSGGTSKGHGDLSYRVVRELRDPGIVAHGVALKPGKPVCLAVSAGKPVVILPGFPTSAIFTFHEFVAPVIRRLAGQPESQRQQVSARLAVKVNSEIGRTEYLLVGLVEAHPDPVPGTSQIAKSVGSPLVAYPMGKGSGSVTTFSRADGFVTIGRHEEIVEAGSVVEVTLLGREWRVADLVVIGSHCVGLDFLLSEFQARGWHTKFLAVGSTAGLEAARRGECDLAGVHLLDPNTGEYNLPFISENMEFTRGYGRLQGVLYRLGDPRFEGLPADQAIAAVKDDPQCLMVNRHQGSGTRVLIDQLLGGVKPRGYAVQPRSHNAVAAAVAQGRADWGVAIKTVADQLGLGFLPLRAEQFDFVSPRDRLLRPAVQAFLALLRESTIRAELSRLGFTL